MQILNNIDPFFSYIAIYFDDLVKQDNQTTTIDWGFNGMAEYSALLEKKLNPDVGHVNIVISRFPKQGHPGGLDKIR